MFNKQRLIDSKPFNSTNFSDALKYVIPSLYFEEDNAKNEKEVDIFDQIINSQLNILDNVSSVVYVSAISGTLFSSLDTARGIAPFFVKQNELTDLSLDDVEKLILLPLGKSITDFKTSALFSEYVTETLLPGIRTNAPTLDFLNGGSRSANHIYLVNNLSWLYFLNLSTTSLTYNPSSYVHDLLINKSYTGESILINDAMKMLTTYIWKNYESIPVWQQLKLLPTDYTPLVEDSQFTSGTQQLDKLLTLIDILYSPLYIDSTNTRVKDAVEDFLQNDITLTKEYNTGPFIKLIKAISFALADYNNQVDMLELLNDINLCPDELLPQLAKLIGWNLFGSNPDRWRLQIVNAVDVYRKVGTKNAVQFAVDSILGQDVFDVSSNISELWESYIPHLVYYALATESTLLKNFSTFTNDIARNFGIKEYSTTSMDENIRLCVDQILYETCLRYRNLFIFNGKPFPINAFNFQFNYRGRVLGIPPFEEIPYYANANISDDMLYFIADRMVCYGVPSNFALQVVDYIRRKTILNSSEATVNNGFLFFTSGAEYPPNWDSIISDITNTRSEYLPLWSGKSSHFSLIFEASSFDFNKVSLEADAGEAMKIAARAAREFSPAHSIPEVMAYLRSEDDYNLSSNPAFNYVKFDKVDAASLLVSSTAGFAMYGASALAMSSYKRGLTPTSVASFSRSDVNSIIDPLLNPTGSVAFLPRRAHRRRNLKNILPKDGFYDRTGFNMPVSFQDYTVSNSNFIVLGLIPSSLTYVPITDYTNIPQIYSICENINSQNSYSGLVISSTYPVRGWKSSSFSSSKCLDRGQLHPFISTLHYIGEQRKLLEASAYYYNNPSSLDFSGWWANVIYSYANTQTELSGAFPNSFDDYVNFSLGRDLHKLYYEYTHTFNTHRVSPLVIDQDGPNILAHALGSLLYNSDLTKRGSLTTQYPSLITTNLASTVNFVAGEGVFSISGTSSGTYIASSILNTGSGTYELRNSGILSHIEFCQPSGVSQNNNFAVIDIDPSFKSSTRTNEILDKNVLIKQSAYDGFGRIIFDISKYQLDSGSYDVQNNFLSPEHEFNIKFKTTLVDPDGLAIGGGAVAVWIHTKPELGKVWSYTSDGTWINHLASELNLSKVLSYSHVVTIPRRQRDLTTSSNFACLRFLDRTNQNRENDVIASLQKEEFSEVSLSFHTRNYSCDGLDITAPTEEYLYNISNNVHRLNQNYVIEIFTIPTQDSRFTLYYDLSMIDLTLNRMSKPFVTKLSNCKELRIDLSKQHLLNIIKYFNQIRGEYSINKINNYTGYASRVASATSGIYEANGGSRINYVEDPAWGWSNENSYNLKETISIIN
jgi:hypothetical protein